jgi:P-type Cu2+ transporter
MLLIGLAITVAFVSSWGASLGVLPHLLIVIMLLCHWIEMGGMGGPESVWRRRAHDR